MASSPTTVGIAGVGCTIYANGVTYAGLNMTGGTNGLYTVSAALPQNPSGNNVLWAFHVYAADLVGNSGMAPYDVIVVESQPATIPPIANNDLANTVLNTPVTFNVIANDSDPSLPPIPLIIASSTQPANGSVVKNGYNTFTCTPTVGYLGSDTFSCTTTNGTYTATAQVTVKVRALAIITETILLQDTPIQNQPVTFKFRSTDNGISSTVTVTPDAAGHFMVPNVLAGTYSLAIKGCKWLQVAGPLDTTNGNVSGITASLRGGDAANDNHVDIGDFGVLVNAYNSDANIPGSGCNVRADFNDDGFVDIADFGILVNSYNAGGDM